MRTKFSKSFMEGFSRTLDLSGTKNWPILSDSRKMDYNAIRSDWENVGRVIERETGRYKRSDGIK